jgi:L-iditol 2-dehydrogenase
VNGKMTAAVLYGKEDIKIEKVPIPRVGEGEVLVKVHVALTCGTDLKVYQRGYHARMIVPPALFGHELAGTVEEVGEGVRGFKKGMRVVALNSAPCGMCFYCSKHQLNLVRGFAVQQRRVRRVHTDSAAYCGNQHACGALECDV